jgi:hypothetical protein
LLFSCGSCRVSRRSRWWEKWSENKNDAGCYAVNFTVDGEDLEVVVDDWFPFYIDISGNEKFCFAQSKTSD